MGQQEIYDVLKAKPNKWHTTKELTEILPTRRNSIRASVKRMIKSGDVEYKETKGNRRSYYEVRIKNM